MDQHAKRMRTYIDALEEEKRKIQVFHRELPLCIDLVNNAIENYRQQLSGTTTECLHGGQSESSEQTSTQRPVLEEFIPIKRHCSSSDDDEDAEMDSRMPSDVNATVAVAVDSSDNKRKSDWLRSAQLWNQTAPDPPPKDDPLPKRVSVLEVKRSGGGAFQPFNREQGAVVETGPGNKQSLLSLDKVHSTVPVAAASSTAGVAAMSGRKDREPAQLNRKQRRNWSAELHRRFLQALQQLGGSHAATPKQIKELMKVDGLTNDEVKSHLQKYRLHTRRPGPSSTIPAAGAEQAPQFVVMGGVWVPPAEYSAVEYGDNVKAPAMYVPAVAISGQQKQPEESEGNGSHSAGGEEAGGARSDSPSTSSSSPVNIDPATRALE